MRSAAFIVALALARAAVAAPADELLERGLRSYAVGRYADAIADFQRGYQIEARPDFLYALAQAQRMSGDCKAAVASYRAYLRTSPPERAAAPARQNLERCERTLAEAPPPASAPSPTPSPAEASPAMPAASPPVAVEAPRRRWQRDPAGAALVGVGLAALAAGAVLWGVGESGAHSLATAGTYDQFAAHAADADTFSRERTAGIVTLAAGGVLVIGGVARWAWLARRR